jgi:hypothetical protein
LPGPVSWRLNNVGRVSLPIARSDPKTTAENFRYGNRVLIQFDNGLPAWGGIIDPPRDWRPGVLVATAYSAEYLLGFRQTDRGRYFNEATAGYIFEQLIIEANEVRDLGISLGNVWYGGGGHGPAYHFGNLLDIVQNSICGRLSTADFDVTAREEDGYIKFAANLYERRGSNKPGVVLQEDINLADIRLLEQGTIINEWSMVGEGTDWGEERPVRPAQDANSIAHYDLRQGSEIFPGTSGLDTLQAAADARLQETKDPKNMWQLQAINLAPARFADYDRGDGVRLLAPSYGFGGSDVLVRVLTREYDSRSQACKLVVRELP